MSTTLSQDDMWKILDSYFLENGLVKQQINSFNEFVQNIVPNIIHSYKFEFDYPTHSVAVQFTNPVIAPPQHVENEADGQLTMLTPHMCRLRDLTYESPLYIDAMITTTKKSEDIPEGLFQKNTTETEIQRFLVCHIPIMLKSQLCVLSTCSRKQAIELSECNYEQGGYFIVNGGEKVIIGQERIANNQVYIFQQKHDIVAEVRSVAEGINRSTTQLTLQYVTKKGSRNALYFKVQGMKRDIPLVILFRALNVIQDTDIHSIISPSREYSRELESSFHDVIGCNTRDQALEYLRNSLTSLNQDPVECMQIVHKILRHDMIPHVSTSENYEYKKAQYLGLMVQKYLSCTSGKTQCDDRDHFGNKRIDLAGPLLGNIFRMSFAKAMKDGKTKLEKKYQTTKNVSIKQELGLGVITKEIKYCLSTGNWTVNKQKSAKTGVAQELSRLTYMASLSYLRRFVAPFAKEGKLIKPRQLHLSSIGLACPSETPEGGGCGLLKNMSMMTDVSSDSPSLSVKRIMQMIINQDIGETKNVRIIINGTISGFVSDARPIWKQIVQLRRKGLINKDVSTCYTQNEIFIYTDSGRLLRPLLVVENNEILVTRSDILELVQGAKYWSDLVREGKVDLIDAMESHNTLIATGPDQLYKNELKWNFTHSEIHPSMILGICGNIVPMANHTAAPRVTYEAAMCKQAMGMYAMNHQKRFDTSSHVMFYPQKPLTPNKPMKYFNFEEMPAGQNAIVAIGCFMG
jgi:DNA-directed RNA polymerase II subunit RPB2